MAATVARRTEPHDIERAAIVLVMTIECPLRLTVAAPLAMVGSDQLTEPDCKVH
jgi:hypothetical protein